MSFRQYYSRLIASSIAGFCLWATLAVAAQADETRQFRLGVITERIDEPDHALLQYSQLNDYLRDQLQAHDIAVGPLVIARDVADLSEKIIANQVDGVIEGVFPTLRIQQQTDLLQLSLLAWRKGQREYYTVFFSRKDSPVATLEDLPGHRLVFEAPRSTSAYAIPKGYLRQQGYTLIPDEQANADAEAIRYVFSGAEVNQAYWVLYGKGDAGAFNDGDWQRLAPGVQEQLRIFARTPPVLRWLLSFRDGTAPEVRAAVEETVLRMHEDPVGMEALRAASNIKRFEALNAEDFANLAAWRDVLLVEDP